MSVAPMPRMVLLVAVLALTALLIAASNPPLWGTASYTMDRSVSSAGMPEAATVRLGYHYRPPTDGTAVEAIARGASFIILHQHDADYARELRRAGYDGPMLQYVIANEAQGPPTTGSAGACDRSFKPWRNQAANQAGDFCTYLHPYEGLFLHDAEGRRLRDENGFYSMNPGSRRWREFVLERLRRFLPAYGYEGIFLDNIELSLDKQRRMAAATGGAIQEYATDEEYVEAVRGFVAYMREGLEPDVPLWANMIEGPPTGDGWQPILPFLDGGMHEYFVTGWPRHPASIAQQNADLAQAEAALRQGKGFYAVAQGDPRDEELYRFALAAYLLIAPEGEAYFRFEDYDQLKQWTPLPETAIALGKALGPRYPIPVGWRRDFEHGSVILDQLSRRGAILPRR